MYAAESLGALRFEYEAHLYSDLSRQPQIRSLQEQIERDHYFSLHKRHLLGTAVKITADLFPALYNVYQNCLNYIGGNVEGHLYVHQDSQYNAHVYAHEQRFDILLTSALVKDFKPLELAFVIGHELGHVLFDHNQIPAGHLLFDEKAEPITAQLAKTLLQWSRAAEITADRIGFLTCGDLSSAANAFFKTACGVYPDSDQQVLSALHAQFDEIERLTADMQQKKIASYASTHPLIPIRFKSLELISLDLLSFRNHGKAIRQRDLSMINQQVQRVLSKTEPVNIDTGGSLPGGREAVETQEEFAPLLLLSLVCVASSTGVLQRDKVSFIQDTAQRLQANVKLDVILQDCHNSPTIFQKQVLEEMRNYAVNQDTILQVLHTCALMCQPCQTAEVQMMRELCRSLRGANNLVDAVLC